MEKWDSKGRGPRKFVVSNKVPRRLTGITTREALDNKVIPLNGPDQKMREICLLVFG